MRYIRLGHLDALIDAYIEGLKDIEKYYKNPQKKPKNNKHLKNKKIHRAKNKK